MRRSVRILLWVAALPALLLVLVLAVIVALNTDAGRREAESLTARLSAGRVVIDGLSGRFPAALRLARLQIADADGVWFTAGDLALDWSPWTVLRHRVQVQRLAAARIDVSRRPLPSDSTSSSSLPRVLDVGAIEVTRLALGEPLAGMPVALTLQARAVLHALDDADVTLDARRLDATGGRYQLRFASSPGRASGELTIAEPAEGVLATLIQLPGLGPVQATARLDGPEQSERLQLEATAGALRLQAQGTLDWRTRRGDITATLRADAMTLRPDLGWRRLEADGRWQGDALQLDARIEGLSMPGPAPTLLAVAPVVASARTDLRATPFRVTARIAHPLLQVDGDATWARPLRIDARVHLPDLAPVARIASLDLGGGAALRVRFTGNGGEGAIDAQGTVDIERGAAPWPALVGREATLVVRGGWKDQSLRIDAARLAGAGAQVTVDGGRGARGEWDLRWRAAVPELAKLSDAFAGALNGSGTLRGPQDDLRAEADLHADASFHGSRTGPLDARVRARGLPSRPVVDADGRGVVADAPLQLAASLVRDAAGVLRVRVPGGSWRSVQLSGDLALPANSRLPRGRMQLHVAQLGDLSVFTGEPLAGALDAALVAAGDGTLHLEAQARGVQARGLDADARLDARGSVQRAEWTLDADVRGLPQGALHVAGRGDGDVAARRVTFAALEARLGDESLRLRERAALAFGDTLSIEHLRVAWREAQFDVDGTLRPALELRATLRGLSPARLAPFLGGDADALPAQGRIAGDAVFTGSLAEPLGSLAMQATALRWRQGDAAGLPALDATAQAALRGAQPAQVSVKVQAGAGTALEAEGEAPLARDGALALAVRGDVDVALANGLLEAGGRRAAGRMHVDGRVAGAPSAPVLGGAITLTNGEWQDYTTGFHVTAIGATLEARGDELAITRFSARAGSGGVEGSGRIGVLAAGMPVSLHVTARDAQPVTSALVTARLDADLSLDGELRGALRLSGRTDVQRAEITIPNALPIRIATLDVRRARRGAATRPVAAAPEQPLAIDVEVNAPRAVFVRGRGLDAELGGALRWRGTRTAPQVSGGFELRTGRFNLAGKTLEFQSGRVSFNGQGVRNQLDPTLDFVASNTSAGVTSTLKVTGHADAPVISLESNPELPQDEVLARLLFGASVTQLTALQVAQMGAAVATLGGIGGTGGGALLAVQRSLGLDRLAISGSGTEGATGATVEAGRYVSRRVYVGTKQSTTGASQAQVEVDVAKGLKVHAAYATAPASAQGTSTTDPTGSTVGLSYEFEY